MDFRLPLGDWVAFIIDWMKHNWDAFFDVVSFIMKLLVNGLTDVLIAVPIPALIIIVALIGWLVRSWQLAVGTIVTFVLIVAVDQWENSMLTLSLVLVATVIAVLISVPLGILAARNDAVSAAIKPVLDFMQTMPAFVYLIPAVTFFSIGVGPGLFSTVIFALPPGVRFTELGIRGVDHETVEAGHAFGATPGRILRGIQLPMATPTIMAGINQVIMLALSMAVVAGIAGMDGLGKEVVASISTLDTAQGVEAGLCVVFLAVYLDRVTAALGNPTAYPHSLVGTLRKRGSSVGSSTAKTGASDEATASVGSAA